MTHFSALSLIKNALSGQKNWEPQWPDSEPKAEYDVIIVGAGGHGLGAAYYLAKEHGITNVAVIDKGWLGGGNTGRIPPSFGRTTSMMKVRSFMTMRLICGMAEPRTELQRHVFAARRSDARTQRS